MPTETITPELNVANLPTMITEFADPPREFSLLPFWFWNDELDEQELLRQIADFDAHGVYGFVIHPRVGLPREIGWMSERMLHFMRLAVAEAARRNMSVILYDEGMYPSGSSSGQVVAENPEYACRCLALEPAAEENGAKENGAGEGGAGQDAPTEEQASHFVAEVEARDGQKLRVVDRPVIATIRGLHYIGEGPEEDAPPAADLLNPEAMECFVRLVYDKYAQHLGQWFGSTILGIFTDEPGLLGKCGERNVHPGTTGILEHVNRILGYDFTPHLPALWRDDEPDAARYRADYKRAVKKRLEETYYAKLSNWCKSHGVALMGHPSEPDDIGGERYFHIPGQDIVWRHIEPNSPGALEGEQSTQAKCSSSAMLHHGCRRNSNECFGAYGHEFTQLEMQWITDWCFVRGVNMLVPHAFYYSVRGPRVDERPPDVGPNSVWWNNYKKYADYCRRLSWLNTDSRHICNIAILGEADRLPWRAAKACFQSQRDFNYLELRDLMAAQVTSEGIFLQGMHYQALILEGDYTLSDEEKAALDTLQRAGCVLTYPGTSESDASITGASESDASIDAALIADLDRIAPRDLLLSPHHPDLRYRHVRKEGLDFYLLFNEGPNAIAGELELATTGKRFWLDIVSAESIPANNLGIELEPYQMKLLCVKSAIS